MITFRALGNYGRLGNQLFQIAATIGLAKKHDRPYVFPAYQWRNENRISVPVADPYHLDTKKWTPRWEHAFTYDETVMRPIATDENINLQGYFQSEKYFEHCKDDVYNSIMSPANITERNLLMFSNNLKSTDDICAVHVRRGDYLGLPDHYINLSESGYFPRAFQHMYDQGVKRFLVFSDDIEWCKRAINAPGFRYSKESNEFDDLLLMSACSHHIISNSSFSWWGSWLAKSKLTVAPAKWFGPALPHDTKDLYRKDMVLLT